MSQAVWLKQQIIYSILTILRVRVQDQAPLIWFLVKALLLACTQLPADFWLCPQVVVRI